ncbi:MAG: DUF2974 domain-containing protein [Propionibacteriales bacterium]|nr:DUF2974 domain-containing protein [Propionibacteriales bacterium]
MSSTMTVTTQSITQATALLESGPGMSDAQQDAGIEILGKSLTAASLVDEKLVDQMVTWISDKLGMFQELLDSLDGDPGAIRSHRDALIRAAGRVDDRANDLRAVTGAVVEWSGNSAAAFRSTSSASELCVRATATTMKSIAVRHITVASQMAVMKGKVIKLVTELARTLCRQGFQFLIEAGLRLAAGQWILAAAAVSGKAVEGGLKGAWNGLKSGNPLGALAGGVKGAVDGGMDEVRRRIIAAVNKFIAWAGKMVSTVMKRVNREVDTSLRPIVQQIGEITGDGNRMERATSLLTTGRDPGNASGDAAQGTAGDTIKGKGPQAKDHDLIKLNQAIGKSDAELPPGYRRASDEDLRRLGLTRKDLTSANGFASEVFVAPDGSSVVAFKGTEGGEEGQKDWAENAEGGFTVSPQTEQTLMISKKVSQSPGGDDVVYTGHSLGGRLASEASMASGNGAVTYNAAGVSPASVDYIAASQGRDPDELRADANNGQVRRYYTGDDPLTAAQERSEHTKGMPDAVGAPVQLSPDAGDLGDVQNKDAYGKGHGQDNVESEWNEKYRARARHGPELVDR